MPEAADFIDTQPLIPFPSDPLARGRAIRARRVERSINQNDFAESVGIKFYALTKIEGGDNGPFGALKAIAQALNFSTTGL